MNDIAFLGWSDLTESLPQNGSDKKKKKKDKDWGQSKKLQFCLTITKT